MKFRMFPFAFLSILGARDYYTYISDEYIILYYIILYYNIILYYIISNVTRMGPSGWLI
jgi:hypothetical protein